MKGVFHPDRSNGGSCSIKREIGHLCHDERKPKPSEKPPVVAAPPPANVELPKNYPGAFLSTIARSVPSQLCVGNYNPHVLPISSSTWPMPASHDHFYHAENINLGNEFAVLTYVLFAPMFCVAINTRVSVNFWITWTMDPSSHSNRSSLHLPSPILFQIYGTSCPQIPIERWKRQLDISKRCLTISHQKSLLPSCCRHQPRRNSSFSLPPTRSRELGTSVSTGSSGANTKLVF